MRKTFTLWAVIGSMFTGAAIAQTPARPKCATDEVEARLLQADPGYQARRQENEAAIARFLANPANKRQMQATKTIPVVFHVVYKTAAENISDAQILSQLEVLNRDFRRFNADTTNTPQAFRSVSADTGIEFCLASVDPNGAPTTGITRTLTTANSFTTNDDMKAAATGGIAAWPRDQYLNIWVCNLSGTTLGYAYKPGAPANIDGVVLRYTTVGAAPANPFPAPYNAGRTATHEVGHWLNLSHIWGQAPGCTDDDLVADTPQQVEENWGCPTYPVTTGTGGLCTAAPTGSMFMNYMDYVDDNCMNLFTQGQGSRMNAAISTSRASLLASTACQNTLMANFLASSTSIQVGTSINFTDLSTGGATAWSWSFPGGTPATSTVQNPGNIVYNTVGVYPVTLTVTKGGVSNTRTIPNYITVNPSSTCAPPAVSFTQTSTSVCQGDTITYNSSATTGATTFQWTFTGGTPATSTAANPTVIYNTPGTHNVTLKATSGCGTPATLNKAVTITAMPTVSVTPTISSRCTPGPVTLTASGATSYSWSPATGLNTTTGSTVTANPSVSTNYTVIGTTNGCASDPVIIPVNVTVVQANFTANPAVVNLPASNGLVTFTNTSSSNALFHNWNFGDPQSGQTNNTSTLKNPTHTYTQAGSYTVTLIATSNSVTGNCSNTKTFVIQVNTVSGLQKAFDAGNIKIYPNPAKDYLRVEVPETEKVTEVQLINTIGQVVARQKPAAGQVRLTLNQAAGGIYFVKIINAEGSITRKVSVIP
ncbi:PKD domain-containing protein [Adhaeribacter soli]|uniref:PKD domain-containing protein n=1 Tax=Adhaeribacter soli TaxID=2607655 RepID=A0A5N1J0P4_9BACT|nr:PKD domain-containing protein [Adhaeribacter soli]KAA9340054.1 PKD domain-containing protein [Adhaeribacter soli]